jgi:GNAT superfamily N-acetyltransferase
MSDLKAFAHPTEIDPAHLQYEPFNQSNQVRDFDSGEPDLDQFLCSEEVAEYDRQNLGRTTLVYYEGDLVAFFTVCVDGLKLDYVQSKKIPKSLVHIGSATVDKIPSIKIGRLATKREWQSKGIGRHLIKHVVGYAIEVSKTTAVRLIIVESKPGSIDFYEKCAFQHTLETKGERKRRNRTLFFDLQGAIKAQNRFSVKT